MFETEKTFPTLGEHARAGRGMRLDIYIPLLNLVIEMDGLQHEKAVDWFGGEVGFLALMRRDEKKRDWCIRYKKSLLRIQYRFYELGLIRELVREMMLRVLTREKDSQPLIVDRFHEKRLELIAEYAQKLGQ